MMPLAPGIIVVAAAVVVTIAVVVVVGVSPAADAGRACHYVKQSTTATPDFDCISIVF